MSRSIFIALLALLSGCQEESSSKDNAVLTPTGSGGNSQAVEPDECRSDDLDVGEAVDLLVREEQVDHRPTPVGGAVPITGTFRLTSWEQYGGSVGSAGSRAGAYRFFPDRSADLNIRGQRGTFSWSQHDETTLLFTAMCPEDAQELTHVVQYTAAGGTFTVFSDEGGVFTYTVTP